MAINFPVGPADGTIYTEAGKRYIYVASLNCWRGLLVTIDTEGGGGTEPAYPVIYRASADPVDEIPQVKQAQIFALTGNATGAGNVLIRTTRTGGGPYNVSVNGLLNGDTPTIWGGRIVTSLNNAVDWAGQFTASLYTSDSVVYLKIERDVYAANDGAFVTSYQGGSATKAGTSFTDIFNTPTNVAPAAGTAADPVSVGIPQYCVVGDLTGDAENVKIFVSYSVNPTRWREITGGGEDFNPRDHKGVLSLSMPGFNGGAAVTLPIIPESSEHGIPYFGDGDTVSVSYNFERRRWIAAVGGSSFQSGLASPLSHPAAYTFTQPEGAADDAADVNPHPTVILAVLTSEEAYLNAQEAWDLVQDQIAANMNVGSGRTVVVDSVNGDDTYAGRNGVGAYSTISAAANAAEAGDTIFVLPGNHSVTTGDCPISRDGVNYMFYPGSNVTVTVTSEDGNGALFGDGTYQVSGDGIFLITGTGYTGKFPILQTVDSESKIHFECTSARVMTPTSSDSVVFYSEDHNTIVVNVKDHLQCQVGDGAVIGQPNLGIGHFSLECGRLTALDYGFSIFNGSASAGVAACSKLLVGEQGVINVAYINRESGSMYLEGLNNDFGPAGLIHIDYLKCGSLVVGQNAQDGPVIELPYASVAGVTVYIHRKVRFTNTYLHIHSESNWSIQGSDPMGGSAIVYLSRVASNCPLNYEGILTRDGFVEVNGKPNIRVAESAGPPLVPTGGATFLFSLDFTGKEFAEDSSIFITVESNVISETRTVSAGTGEATFTPEDMALAYRDGVRNDPLLSTYFEAYTEGPKLYVKSLDPGSGYLGSVTVTGPFADFSPPNCLIEDFGEVPTAGTRADFGGQLYIMGDHPGPYRVFTASSVGFTTWVELTDTPRFAEPVATTEGLWMLTTVPQVGQIFTIPAEGGRQLRWRGDMRAEYTITDPSIQDPILDPAGFEVSLSGDLLDGFWILSDRKHGQYRTYQHIEFFYSNDSPRRLVWVTAGDTTYDAGESFNRWAFLAEAGYVVAQAEDEGVLFPSDPWDPTLVWSIIDMSVVRRVCCSHVNWEVLLETFELYVTTEAAGYHVNGFTLSSSYTQGAGYVRAGDVPEVTYDSGGDGYAGDDLSGYNYRISAPQGDGSNGTTLITNGDIAEFFQAFRPTRKRILHIKLA